jgi:hypothetical protein
MAHANIACVIAGPRQSSSRRDRRNGHPDCRCVPIQIVALQIRAVLAQTREYHVRLSHLDRLLEPIVEHINSHLLLKIDHSLKISYLATFKSRITARPWPSPSDLGSFPHKTEVLDDRHALSLCFDNTLEPTSR